VSELGLPCSGLPKSGVSDITISVSGSNILGTGPTSHVSVGMYMIYRYYDYTASAVNRDVFVWLIKCLFATVIHNCIMYMMECCPSTQGLQVVHYIYG
jgi:hypothetical protein